VGSTPEFTKRPRRRLFDACAFFKEFANALSGKVRDAFEDLIAVGVASVTNYRNIDDPSRVIDAINYAVIADTNSRKIPIALEFDRAPSTAD